MPYCPPFSSTGSASHESRHLLECCYVADSVAKAPKCRATNFRPNDKTSGSPIDVALKRYQALSSVATISSEIGESSSARSMASSVEQALALKREDIDFGFINGHKVPSGLDGFRYWSEPFYACLPQGHSCAKGRTVKLEDLANEEFVMFGRSASPEYFVIIMDLCRSAGIEPTGKHEVRHWMSVISSVAHGLGVALVPRSLKSSGVAGVVFLPLTRAEGISETWCVWKSDRELSNGTKAFLSAARQNVSCGNEAVIAVGQEVIE